MSEGGTIKQQLDRIDVELEMEEQLWRKANLPPVKETFNLGNNQFSLHVNMIATIELLKELLGEEKVQLATKKAALRQLQIIRPGVEELVKQARRAAIVDGVIPPRPPEI